MPPTKRDPFTILETELAKELDISLQVLDEVIKFFDSVPDDPWDLLENVDYIFTNKAKKIRRFSPKGALKIASYLDVNHSYGFIHKIKEFFTKHTEKLHKALARKVIFEELDDSIGKLIRVNNHSFLHKQSFRRILGTSGARLKRALDDIRTSDTPLEIGIDFVEQEFSDPKDKKKGQQLWFSGRGSIKISREDNLITIDTHIHQEFHAKMGGFNSTCTIKDFIDFVTDRYPDQATPELMNRLFHAQKVLKPEP